MEYIYAICAWSGWIVGVVYFLKYKKAQKAAKEYDYLAFKNGEKVLRLEGHLNNIGEKVADIYSHMFKDKQK